MTSKKLTIGVVGNLLGHNRGYGTTQGQVLASHLQADGNHVVHCSSVRNQMLRLADIIVTILRNKRRVDVLVVEVYSGLSFVIADVVSLLGNWLKIPLIAVLHGGNLPQFYEKRPYWARRVLRRYDRMVAPSAFLSKAMAVHGFSIRVIPNVIQLEGYPYRLRKKLKPALIWMRAFHTIYNPEMAIRVHALVRRDHPDATLVMAGVDKGLEAHIKRIVSEIGLDDSVRFPGFLNHDAKIEEFSEADIYLNTNHIDNMPVAVVEACAMGLPVVATNVGGLKDLITDRGNGILIGDGDIEQMANAVNELLENPELAEHISRNGHSVAKRSSWSSVRSSWDDLFADVLDGKRDNGAVAAEFLKTPTN